MSISDLPVGFSQYDMVSHYVYYSVIPRFSRHSHAQVSARQAPGVKVHSVGMNRFLRLPFPGICEAGLCEASWIVKGQD